MAFATAGYSAIFLPVYFLLLSLTSRCSIVIVRDQDLNVAQTATSIKISFNDIYCVDVSFFISISFIRCILFIFVRLRIVLVKREDVHGSNYTGDNYPVVLEIANILHVVGLDFCVSG